MKEVYEAESSAETKGPGGRSDRLDFGPQGNIPVKDRDPGSNQLLLERVPDLPELLLRPNTWQIDCQIRALQALQNSPSPSHMPLLRLFERIDHAKWPLVVRESIEAVDWMVLTDQSRDGTDEQRRFVEQALGTPDFAFLEGPPGSGKTTAICELVLATRQAREAGCFSRHLRMSRSTTCWSA